MSNYEVGKVYNINHSRKGRMTVKVTAVDDTWINCEIIDGTAFMLSGDHLEAGEPLTFRASLADNLGEVSADHKQPTSEYVPMEHWWKDHWSTLAYVNHQMIETGSGFEVGYDPRMTHNAQNHQFMRVHGLDPQRANPSKQIGPVMDDKYSTRIKVDGEEQQVIGNDDWSCVQDMAHAGLFTVGPEYVVPGESLKFSDKGFAIASALTRHKQEGGNFSDFVYLELADA